MKQFLTDLVASGLIKADELRAFMAEVPQPERPHTTKDLANLLVREKKLTRYQALAITQGKAAGLLLGNYEVLDRIGEGGMGLVFLARHRKMKREVALKVLPGKFTNSRNRRKRFEREAEAAAQLSHPNIVTAHDFDEAKGVCFLVTEYVDGGDLARRVGDLGPLPIDTALDYVRQAAEGLRYAHQQGIIHRDVKPSNLLVDREGRIKVLDMGLARRLEAEDDADTRSEPLTEYGSVLGTVDFMAPEQAKNASQADGRSDIYSLGCTLYFLLTGEAPTPSGSLAEKLLWHQSGDSPRLEDKRPDVPRELCAVFDRMVAKAPEERFQDMRGLIKALEAVPIAALAHTVLLPRGSLDPGLQDFFSRLEHERAAAPEAALPSALDTADQHIEHGTLADEPEPAAVPASRRGANRKLAPWMVWGGACAAAIVLVASLAAWLNSGDDEPDRASLDSPKNRQDGAKAGSPEGSPAVPQNGGPHGGPRRPPRRLEWDEDILALLKQHLPGGETSAMGRRIYGEMAALKEVRATGGWYIGRDLGAEGHERVVYVQSSGAADAKELVGLEGERTKLLPKDGVLNLLGGEFSLPQRICGALEKAELVQFIDASGQAWIVGEVAADVRGEEELSDLSLVYDAPVSIGEHVMRTTLVQGELRPGGGTESGKRRLSVCLPGPLVDAKSPVGLGPDALPVVPSESDALGDLYLSAFFQFGEEGVDKLGTYRLTPPLKVRIAQPRWNQELKEQLESVLNVDPADYAFVDVYGSMLAVLEHPEYAENARWLIGEKLTRDGKPYRARVHAGTLSIVPTTINEITEAGEEGEYAADRIAPLEAGFFYSGELPLAQLDDSSVEITKYGDGRRFVKMRVKVEVLQAHRVAALALVIDGPNYIAACVYSNREIENGTLAGEFNLDPEFDLDQDAKIYLRGFTYWPRPGRYRLSNERTFRFPKT